MLEDYYENIKIVKKKIWRLVQRKYSCKSRNKWIKLKIGKNCQFSNSIFWVSYNYYAWIQAIGIIMRPPSEKNHNFQKNASILVNKVTFFPWNICPHDKTNLKVHKKYFRLFWGHILAIFVYFFLFVHSTKSIGQLLAFINICHVCFIICAFTCC